MLSLDFPDQPEAHAIHYYISPFGQTCIDYVLARLLLCHFSYTHTYPPSASLP
jgi:hypothetical protein